MQDKAAARAVVHAVRAGVMGKSSSRSSGAEAPEVVDVASDEDEVAAPALGFRADGAPTEEPCAARRSCWPRSAETSCHCQCVGLLGLLGPSSVGWV